MRLLAVAGFVPRASDSGFNWSVGSAGERIKNLWASATFGSKRCARFCGALVHHAFREFRLFQAVKWSWKRNQINGNGWLPFLDTYRTMCRAPEPTFWRLLEDIRELRFAA